MQTLDELVRLDDGELQLGIYGFHDGFAFTRIVCQVKHKGGGGIEVDAVQARNDDARCRKVSALESPDSLTLVPVFLVPSIAVFKAKQRFIVDLELFRGWCDSHVYSLKC